jgi:hemerythrin superfamily protein
MANGIDLILQDHERVNDLFAAFAEAGDSTAIGQILDVLTAHDGAEHAALYPLAETLLDDEALLARCKAAHSEVKRLIDYLRAQEGAPLVDAVEALRTAVTEHVQDEEENLLPALAKVATPAQLEGLAARIEQNKQRVG